VVLDVYGPGYRNDYTSPVWDPSIHVTSSQSAFKFTLIVLFDVSMSYLELFFFWGVGALAQRGLWPPHS
jgi:hypothetical protein